MNTMYVFLTSLLIAGGGGVRKVNRETQNLYSWVCILIPTKGLKRTIALGYGL